MILTASMLLAPTLAWGIAQQDPNYQQPASQQLRQDQSATMPSSASAVVGTIVEVRDDSFSVRKDADQSLVWFTITPDLKQSASAELVTGNVVPLTMGTPLPAGLPPDERVRHEKARRLARVLASDIAIYNREKKDRGIQEGNLVAVLGYEIKKSWETYKERVGAEFANSTPYFRDALNDMLAEGKKVF